MTTNLPPTDSFGYVRTLLLETVAELRENKMNVHTGMAIAANMKVLNDNIFAEIAVAKMALLTAGHANKFGEVMRLGTQVIGLAAPVYEPAKS